MANKSTPLNKRDRCSNWEREEKELLRRILRPYLETLENKDLTTNTNKAKFKAWREITEKFNLLNTRFREKKHLINQWKTMKFLSKKGMAHPLSNSNSICEIKTDGGLISLSPCLNNLEDADMTPLEFCEISNEYACDGESPKVNTGVEEPQASTSEQAIKMEPLKENTDDEPQDQDNTEREDSFQSEREAFEDIHQFRVQENERRQKEHELRMAQMTEAHKQLMLNLKLQHQILKTYLLSEQ